MIRVGLGQDSHRFSTVKKDRALVLGGVEVDTKGGFEANSDGDIILHSLCNALSSAIGGDSLSTWADEMNKRGVKDSVCYLEHIFNKIVALKYSVVNISVSVEAKKPYLKIEIINQIKIKIASLLRIKVDQVGLTFTSGEGLTAFGRGEGMQALAIVSILKHD